MKVAVVGATGLVGGVMMKVLEERGFPVTELIPVASEKSVGKEVRFRGIGADVCRSGVHRHRQFFRMAHGPFEKTGRAGDQRRCLVGLRQDHRQPQLFHHPDGTGAEPAS